MLPVNIHQICAELPEHRNRQQHAADSADVPAGIGNFPAHRNGGAIKIHLFPSEDLLHSGISRYGKDCLHGGLVTSGSDETAVCPAAQGQIHRVHHDALPGAGFTGKHLHAGMKLQGQGIDEGDMRNR